MGYPVDFAESNITMKGWPASEDEEEVLDLPAHRTGIDTHRGATAQTVSCWKLSFVERLKVLFFGKVWLYVIGNAHPPICVDAKHPFIKPDKVGREGVSL